MNELVSAVQSETAALTHNPQSIHNDFPKEDSGSKPTMMENEVSILPLTPKSTQTPREYSPMNNVTPKSNGAPRATKSQKTTNSSPGSSTNFSSYLNSVLSGREAAVNLSMLSQSPSPSVETPKSTAPQSPLSSFVTVTPSTPSTSGNGSASTPMATSSNVSSAQPMTEPLVQSPGQSLPTTQNNSNASTQVVVYPQSNEKERYVDITEYLSLPQTEAARRLNIPTSTLSKRWKEAVVNRKWPYRTICKLDKEIMTLLHNIPHGPDAPPLPPEIEGPLGLLLKKRQEELRTVIIRL
jgi:hypothetical protein